MTRFVLAAMLVLAACAVSDAKSGTGDVEGWQLASGKKPTPAEYAAVVAACQDGSPSRAATKPFEDCLAELGLKRIQ